ncbi:MAG: 1-acyl-sn-glycerol-3-phosphate acyltransferase [Oscillospiraceae bacterium]|nr:1-acyl-sn-glycerol-3-phosphate acyltransferase [Oscillospiraceae bacterium]
MTCFTLLALALVSAVVICMKTGNFENLCWLWLLPVGWLGSLVGLLMLIFLLVLAMSAAVDTGKPQKKDNGFYRFVIGCLIELIQPILQIRLHTEGLEKTPKAGRFMLVCNHINDLDPPMLLHCFRKSQLAFISKRENTTMFVVGKLMHKIMCQLINRENDREALKTILACIRLIQEDEVSIAVFPEGYTSMDGLLHPFRNGVFKIAQKTGVPIVVCTLRNTNQVFRNALRLKPTDVHLHLVAVIPPEEIKGQTTVDVGNRVHRLMAEDLGEDLVLKESS